MEADTTKKKQGHQGNRRIQSDTVKPRIIWREQFQFWLRHRYLWMALGTLLVLCVLGMFLWQRWVTYQWVEFFETKYASRNDLYNLVQAKVPTHKMQMNEVDEATIVAQVKKHPWVLNATVNKHLNGMISVYVQEKQPVILVLNRQGLPTHYLDANALPMPYQPGIKFNVPLLRGVLPNFYAATYQPSGVVKQLARDLAQMKVEQYALISEFEVQPSGNIICHTIPTANNESLLLKMGKGGFIEKIIRFDAFWKQIVQTQTKRKFDYVDLRFDGQVVTKEKSSK